jgi:hypothetical protein
MAQTYREKATQIAEAEAAAGVREVGTNRGPRVTEYQEADGLAGEGYPWCASFVAWCFEQAGRPLEELKESASVGFMLSYSKQHNWNISRAQVKRGDCVCFYWAGDDWPDHIGFVTGTKGASVIYTVEGNTSPETGGGPDGVYHKVRGNERMAFFRVPGVVTDRKPTDVVVPQADWFKAWAPWRLQKPLAPKGVKQYLEELEKWKAARPKDAPREIPDRAWERLVDGLRK